MKTYEDYLKEYKGGIKTICKNLKKQYNSPRIEMDDLYQQATIALWGLYKAQAMGTNKCILLNRRYSLTAIKNKVRDWLRKETSISVTDPKTGKQKRVIKPLYQAENKGLIVW